MMQSTRRGTSLGFEDFEILRGPRTFAVGTKGVVHRNTVEFHLLNTVHSFGRSDAGSCINRRSDINDVMKLGAHTSGVGDVVGPRDCKPITGAPKMRRDLFHPLEW